MNKYDFFNTHGQDAVEQLRSEIKFQEINKYYNLWMSKLEWKGLDEEVKDQQANYIMRKFWSDGTVSAFKIKNTNLLGYAPYNVQSLGMYDFPETLRLVNTRNISKQIIPNRELTVNKDVVIGYCLPSRKSIASIVTYYVNQIVEVKLVIDTNLNLHKMPFVIACDENEKKKLTDCVERILSGQQMVVTSVNDLQKIQAFVTNTPFIIDKLHTYKKAIEGELLTVLGVDNNDNNKTHITMDAIDANNEEINNYDNAIKQELQFFVDNVNRVFGRNISFEDKAPDVKSIEEGDDGNVYNQKNVPNNAGSVE